MKCRDFQELPCSVCDMRSVFVVSEQRSEFRLENPQKKTICKIQIDGCESLLIDSSALRCDYLFIICEEPKPVAIFVELKGTDLIHAAKQLLSSFLLFEDKLTNIIVNARIVSTRVDQTELRFLKNDPAVKKLNDKLRKFGTELKLHKSKSPEIA